MDFPSGFDFGRMPDDTAHAHTQPDTHGHTGADPDSYARRQFHTGFG